MIDAEIITFSIINLSKIDSVGFLGALCISSPSLPSMAIAIPCTPSVIMFIHNNWIAVNGNGKPKIIAKINTPISAKAVEIKKYINFLMFA